MTIDILSFQFESLKERIRNYEQNWGEDSTMDSVFVEAYESSEEEEPHSLGGSQGDHHPSHDFEGQSSSTFLRNRMIRYRINSPEAGSPTAHHENSLSIAAAASTREYQHVANSTTGVLHRMDAGDFLNGSFLNDHRSLSPNSASSTSSDDQNLNLKMFSRYPRNPLVAQEGTHVALNPHYPIHAEQRVARSSYFPSRNNGTCPTIPHASSMDDSASDRKEPENERTDPRSWDLQPHRYPNIENSSRKYNDVVLFE